MVRQLKTERTTVTLPIGLRDRAHDAGINISSIAADAVCRKLSEKETGDIAAKQTPPAVNSQGATV